MPELRHLLLVPTEKGAGLLREGPCGLRMPTANEVNPDIVGKPAWWRPGRGYGDCRLALPLIWEGEILNEACDRAARTEGGYEALPGQWSAGLARLLAKACEVAGLAEVVEVSL